MKYQLKQRLFSFVDAYSIGNSLGHPVYRIQGKFFSFGHDLSFQTVEGFELAQIRQRLLTLLPKFEIYVDNRPFATIVKEFTWFNCKFTLDVPGPNDYIIDGSFWEYEYTFKRRGRVVALVSKEFWSFADMYGVDIVDGEDDVSILATMAVIDLCCHRDRN